jgi:hypothetical protein
MRYVLANCNYKGKIILKDKKWSKEIEEYDIAVDGVKFKNLTKEQYELLYKLKGST